MKKIYLVPFIIAIGLSACKEDNNLVQLTPPVAGLDQLVLDTTFANASVPAAQAKNVLLEDFTAVHCDNCPLAQSLSESIVASESAGRVAVIGIHCTSLDVPGQAGFPDFRTSHGDAIANAIDSAIVGLPQGDVDRKLYSGQNQRAFGIAFWQTYVDSELLQTPIVNIDIIKKSYDSSSRTLNMTLNATFTQSSPIPYYMSVALIESGMKGSQLTPSNVNDTFTFEHVLRKFMNPFDGLRIASAPVKGTTYQVQFSTKLDPSWNPANCSIIAFVHQRLEGNKNVEQVLLTTVK